MTILLPIIAGIVCLISFLLLLRDVDHQRELYESGDCQEKKTGLSLPAMIYSFLCILITVAIAVFLPSLYPGNSVWINIKKMVLLAIIWPLAYIDIKTYRIPNKFILLGLICRGAILIFEFLFAHEGIWVMLISEVIAVVALLLACLLCVLVVKNGIGFGDMKLFIIMGLLLGTEGIWSAIFLALIVSFFIAVFVLLTKKKTSKDAIPFGPAIVIGVYLSVCLSGM